MVQLVRIISLIYCPIFCTRHENSAMPYFPSVSCVPAVANHTLHRLQVCLTQSTYPCFHQNFSPLNNSLPPDKALFSTFEKPQFSSNIFISPAVAILINSISFSHGRPKPEGTLQTRTPPHKMAQSATLKSANLISITS